MFDNIIERLVAFTLRRQDEDFPMGTLCWWKPAVRHGRGFCAGRGFANANEINCTI